MHTYIHILWGGIVLLSAYSVYRQLPCFEFYKSCWQLLHILFTEQFWRLSEIWSFQGSDYKGNCHHGQWQRQHIPSIHQYILYLLKYKTPIFQNPQFSRKYLYRTCWPLWHRNWIHGFEELGRKHSYKQTCLCTWALTGMYIRAIFYELRDLQKCAIIKTF